MSAVTLKRDADGYQALRASELEAEIERAKSGAIQSVGREAASYYLGIHTRTLSRYNAQGMGPKSTSLSSSGGLGQTAKVFYKLSDLDEWREQLSASSYKERKIKSSVAAKKTELALLELELENKGLQSEIARLKRLLDKKSIGFAGIHDATFTLPWIFDDHSRLLGTVYDLSDEDVISALTDCRIEYLSPLEALELQWADINVFVQWADAIRAALTSGTQELDELRVSRVQRHELMSHVGGGDGEG
ncbi:TPA: hypothetical protein ACG4NT_000022 [Stenotrophomonas maltophilia]|uniref:hypothetical protein n=1 Tax=Stenotrophomonas maltophilia TaxID=40324 RepID=UPI0002C53C9A|nr:hypothetical protein [Stenotrophomonas maltophilia]MCD5965588.1 hypothetical protein [Stenotrophomonas maltophilia]QGL75277.1 hypothetical protein FEO95_06400 [Stenotrophomonas maltophilia]CCP15438.1 putative nucleotide-binding enzyme [Stenotrophomonas maltophilia RA8]